MHCLSVGQWLLILMHFHRFCRIGRCRQKITLERATVIIMIVPMWTTQEWFTRLLSLLACKEVLSHLLKSRVHPPSPVDGMQIVSGKILLTAVFLQMLPMSCARGDRALRNNLMSRHSVYGENAGLLLIPPH
jgi:hypothetical protein